MAIATKQLPLSQGLFAEVDADFSPPGTYCAHRMSRRVYATRGVGRAGGGRTLRALHHDVLGLSFENPPEVDHIDGDGLNNRKENLRIVTRAENLQAKQRKSVGCSSRFRGVTWNKHLKKWQAQVEFNKKNHYVGLFNNEIEAAKARDKKALELFGPIAHLNFS